LRAGLLAPTADFEVEWNASSHLIAASGAFAYFICGSQY